ncbi:hypothetical protein HDU89_008584 [Geranomyces variabilis]|nr:hypothetical protein HDU89_008584 [Geranomyces variabilis]
MIAELPRDELTPTGVETVDESEMTVGALAARVDKTDVEAAAVVALARVDTIEEIEATVVTVALEAHVVALAGVDTVDESEAIIVALVGPVEAAALAEKEAVSFVELTTAVETAGKEVAEVALLALVKIAEDEVAGFVTLVETALVDAADAQTQKEAGQLPSAQLPTHLREISVETGG